MYRHLILSDHWNSGLQEDEGCQKPVCRWQWELRRVAAWSEVVAVVYLVGRCARCCGSQSDFAVRELLQEGTVAEPD